MIKELSMGEIYKEHLKTLNNLNIPHKKLIIFFAGIPGSGKTCIARILETKYSAVRISNDNLRRIIRKLYKKKFKIYLGDVDTFLHDYWEWFISDYNFPNKLIIADRGIERKYRNVFSFVKKLGYKIFIINVKINSRKLLEKRVKKKLGGKLDKNFIENIDRWINENGEFNQNVKSNIVIDNSDENKLNFQQLFYRLDKFINN